MFKYEFEKVYEMDYIVTIATIKAKDMHDAMRKLYAEHSEIDYDLISVNGEWI